MEKVMGATQPPSWTLGHTKALRGRGQMPQRERWSDFFLFPSSSPALLPRQAQTQAPRQDDEWRGQDRGAVSVTLTWSFSLSLTLVLTAVFPPSRSLPLLPACIGDRFASLTHHLSRVLYYLYTASEIPRDHSITGVKERLSASPAARH
ncbi:hypothetical protein E2C01_035168 [Portunus trituberculatus]|uniref:Uncharacterized protein n=1 Tax=Portunus trituberculatus TaxID=210409 RepID=A0A5B7F8L8_PORTR|nr:hypothetical protein [Portunus trituberculatus]